MVLPAVLALAVSRILTLASVDVRTRMANSSLAPAAALRATDDEEESCVGAGSPAHVTHIMYLK